MQTYDEIKEKMANGYYTSLNTSAEILAAICQFKNCDVVDAEFEKIWINGFFVDEILEIAWKFANDKNVLRWEQMNFFRKFTLPNVG